MIPSYRIASLIVAAAVLGLALWIIWLEPRRAEHRALARFLLLRVAFYGVLSFGPAPLSPLGRMVPAIAILIIIAAIDLVFVFKRLHGPPDRPTLHWSWRALLWLVGGGLVALHLAVPTLYAPPSGAGAFQLLVPSTYLAFAFVAYVLGTAAVGRGDGPQRKSLMLLAFAFGVEPAYVATFRFVEIASHVGTVTVMQAATAAVVGTALGLVVANIARWRWHAKRLDKTLLRPARAAAYAIAFPVASGVAVWVIERMASTIVWFHWFLAIDAAWHFVGVGLVTFAVVQYELFGIQLHAKVVLRQAVTAVVFAVAFVVLSELIEAAISIDSSAVTVIAAILIALVLHPVQRAAKALAERLMPGVVDTEEYRRLRRIEVYRVTYASVSRDGTVTASERSVLDRLATKLGLVEAETRRLEADLLT